MDSPEQWRWVWIITSAVFAVGEMATPGSFFLAPLAVGALAAAILAFAGVGVATEWVVFLVVTVVTFAALRPLARRLDRSALDQGIGARRLTGNRGTVLRDIPGQAEIGMVRIDREEWRAQSADGSPIPAGAIVRVADVQGTRVIVARTEAPVAEAGLPPPVDPPPVDPPPSERSDST
jgi:membrane protein implicated in regulation of membrane protease activity